MLARSLEKMGLATAMCTNLHVDPTTARLENSLVLLDLSRLRIFTRIARYKGEMWNRFHQGDGCAVGCDGFGIDGGSMGGVTTGDGVGMIDGDMVDADVDTGVGTEACVRAGVLLLSWAGGDGDTVGVGVISDVGGVSSSLMSSYSSLISNV